jgi:hypothetical protein
MPFEKGCKRAPTAGRKPGQSNKNTAEVKALAMKDVPHVLKELVRLALHATNEATRVAACKELLDRAIGKAVQPRSGESGEGPVIVQVITGVPRSGELAEIRNIVDQQGLNMVNQVTPYGTLTYTMTPGATSSFGYGERA